MGVQSEGRGRFREEKCPQAALRKESNLRPRQSVTSGMVCARPVYQRLSAQWLINTAPAGGRRPSSPLLAICGGKTVPRCKPSADTKYQSCLDSARQCLKSSRKKGAAECKTNRVLQREAIYLFFYVFILRHNRQEVRKLPTTRQNVAH